VTERKNIILRSVCLQYEDSGIIEVSKLGFYMALIESIDIQVIEVLLFQPKYDDVVI
jgi:hypothetical protein